MSLNACFLATCVLLILFCLIGLVGNVLLLISLMANSLLHSNVKWLLGNTSLAAIIACLHLFTRSSIHLGQGVVVQRSMPADLCMAEEIPFTAAIFVLFLSILTVGTERLWATIKKRYADSSGFLGLALCMGLWTLNIMLCATMLVLARKEKPVTYCSILFVQNPVLFYIVNALLVINDISGVALFLALYRTNTNSLYQFGINLAATQNLAARFQIRRNIDTTRMLIPSMVIHLCCYATFSTLAFVVFQKRHEVGIEKAIYVNLVYLCIALHSFLHPLVVFLCSKSLRRTLKKLFFSWRSDSSDYDHINGSNSSGTRARTVVEFRRTPEEYSVVLTSTWRSIDRKETFSSFRVGW